VSKLRGKKFIYDAHEYFPYVPEVIERPFTQKVWLLIERMTVPKADLAYTVSQSLAAEFESVYKRPFEVIRNVPFEREQIKCDKTDKIIIYQGALNAGRGLEQLLLATVGTDWKIYIFGDGDIKPILLNMMAELNLENNVFLKGKLSPSILWQETQKAYIGINLAEDKSLSYKLSLSNKLFDYIQAGVPQVMINLPEFVHLNEQLNFGIIIHSLEANEIRTAINRLLNDDDLYQNLVKNCISLKEVHNWENESKKIVNLYDALFR
jgi:glycosyltransferase involved in cell wall biosynthesis